MTDPIFKQPGPIDVHGGNMGESFKKWKRELDIYMEASGMADKSKKRQIAVILSCAGSDIIEASEHFIWLKADGTAMSDEDKAKPYVMLQKIEEYCIPRQSEVLMSFRFWNVAWQTPFDSLLTELRTRTDACNFQERDRMIRDKIVFTAKGKIQELLLRDANLNLHKAIDICRAYEQSMANVKEFCGESSSKIDQVSKKSQKSSWKSPSPSYGKAKSDAGEHSSAKESEIVKDCNFCGGNHQKGCKFCPAYGKICMNCNGRHHFKIKCKKTSQVHSLGVTWEPNGDSKWLATVNSKKGNLVYAKMQVNDCNVLFQVDGGAEVNTLQQQYVRRDQVKETKTSLVTWDLSKVTPLGEVVLPVFNPKTGETLHAKFCVVENRFDNLLGLETSKDLGLLTINVDKFISKLKVGDTLGDLGESSLVVNNDIPPRVLPCRRIPIAIKDEVHCEIDKLVDRKILIPIEEPTRWVSQMCVPRKSNGKLRVCIDPQPLNEALMREHYMLPTLDDVLPKLLNAKVFSKVDVKEAFWHVKLDEKSSKLTTMITPFGRFRWARLPFGLKV